MFDKPLNTRQKAMVILMDALLLLELTLTIYFSSRNPEEMTLIFLKTYVPVCLLTVFGCRWIIRRLGDAETRTTEATS